MIETIIIAMLVAKIRGYKLKPIFLSWEVYPILAFAGLYMFLNMEVFLGNYNFIKYAGILETIYICTFLILIYWYKQYVSAIIGSIAIIIGTLLNKVAIYANGGKMPVFPTLSYITGYVRPDVFTKVKDIHVMGSEATKLIFLTDIVDLGYSILSIGDIFIRFFAFIIIYSCIKSANNIKEKVDDDVIGSTV
ncbi:DUF5317 domain-containing protein [Clostridium omnivorum]|uniref:DUF5317 domain-containing protein n=1 Tax=Clostridium omnivorum TaxID=1604902 RepID=A0ABQ5N5J0_9CLOT|nr:DUF5317 domain-containing protein [Clostridium sp. E14]GLC30507.1 hypothetical protein bsdE14_19170 [Clostridium sp. E14]